MQKFIRISEKAAKDASLSFTDISVLLDISRYANTGNYVEFRYITSIMESLNIKSEHTINKSLKKLQIAGYLKITHIPIPDKKQIMNTYQIFNMENFILVKPHDGLLDLTYKELGLLIKLKAYCLDNGLTLKPETKGKLIKWVGCDYKTIEPMLASLEQKGFITRNKLQITLSDEIFEDLNPKKKATEELMAAFDEMLDKSTVITPILQRYKRMKAKDFKGVDDVYSYLTKLISGASWKPKFDTAVQQEYITM
jgi:DNA-binding MarR family transcriptional regulator